MKNRLAKYFRPVFLLITVIRCVSAAPGEIDSGFHSALSNIVQTIELQADGKILAGELISTFQKRLSRLLPTGELDRSFAITLDPPGALSSSILLPDGKVLLSGSFVTIQGSNRQGMARLNADGTIDETFDVEFTGATTLPPGPPLPPGSPTFAVKILTPFRNGDVFVSTRNVFGPNGLLLPPYVRLQSDGNIESAFDLNFETILFVKELTDGHLLIQRDRQNTLEPRFQLLRCTSDGKIDPSFQPSLSESFIGKVLEQPDGKLTVISYSVYRQHLGPIVRLNSDGTIDWSFFPELRGEVADAVLQTDGKLIVCGSFLLVDDSTMYSLARFKPNGEWDYTFKPRISANNGYSVSFLALQADGKLLGAGQGELVGNQFENTLLRYYGDEAQSGGVFFFDKQSYRTQEGTPKLAITVSRTSGHKGRASVQLSTRNGTALSGEDYEAVSQSLLFEDGESEKTIELSIINDELIEPIENLFVTLSDPLSATVGWQSDAMIELLDDDGPASLSGHLNISFENSAKVLAVSPQSDGKLVIAGAFSMINKEPTRGIVRMNPDGSRDYSFNLDQKVYFSDAPAIENVQLQADGKMLITGTFSPGVARVFSNGDLDPSFQLPLYFSGQYFLLRPNGKIAVIGAVDDSLRYNYLGVAQLNQDGSIDSTFTNSTPELVPGERGALMEDGRLIVAGGAGVARIKLDGELDESFVGPKIENLSVSGVAIALDQKVLLAGYFPNTGHQCVIRLNSNGTVDETFYLDVSLFGTELLGSQVALQADGKILATVEEFNGDIDYVVRFNSDGTIEKTFEPVRFNTKWGNQRAISVLDVQPNGTVIVGGYFHDVNEVPLQNLAILKGGGGSDDPSSENPVSCCKRLRHPDAQFVRPAVTKIQDSYVARPHELVPPQHQHVSFWQDRILRSNTARNQTLL